ncbi:MAG TPA: hypothetical protein VIQ50_05510, partial [Xanthobacteraceae bacterium]
TARQGEDARMKRSTDRILTTHVGSLIRPPALREFLAAKEAGKPFDQAAYANCLKECVAEVVCKQADIGIDVISDGEFGKAISWAQYALFRLGGFERRPFAGGNPFTRGVDRTRFAELRGARRARQGRDRDGYGGGGADHLCRRGRTQAGRRQLQGGAARR